MEVHRRKNETIGSLLRRFTRRIQQSGILLRARKLRYHEDKPSRRAEKDRALRRLALKAEGIRLEKLGKTPTE